MQEEVEQPKFLCGQIDWLTGYIGGTGHRIEHDIAMAQFGGGLACDAAHQRAKARRDFVDVKRLRHVVVGTSVETLDLFGPATARRQDQNRRGRPGAPQAS
jgi:hypothetical protein